MNSFGQPNDGLPTYPYDAPLVDFVGRYVDSSNTIAFQHVGIRTVRAGLIRVAPEQRGVAPARMYLALGEAVGAYNLSTFFNTKLPGGMQQVNRIPTGGAYSYRAPDPLEKALIPESFLYPETTGSKWRAPFQDGQTRLFDFDYDDRGNLYAAYSVFGWGIVKDEGITTGGHMPIVSQKIGGGVPDPADKPKFPATQDDPNGVTSPKMIMAFKSAAKYYAIVSDFVGAYVLYDVTDPAVPKNMFKRNRGNQDGIQKWDRHDGAKRLAYVSKDGHLYVYDYADFAAGGSPVGDYTGRVGAFTDVSFDEAGNIWATDSRNLWKFDAVGNGYNAIPYTPFGSTFEPAVLHAAAGHVVVAGTDRNEGIYDVRLLKVDASGPVLVNTDKFFGKYYHTAPQGYAEACVYCGRQVDVQLVKQNGRTYLMYSVFGLGDVYEIQGGDSIHLSKKDTFGTANPNSKATEPGPYVGDTVTFNAASSSANTSYDVTWNFGNPESSDNTAGPKKTGLDVSHQYTGLTTASAITSTKTVKAVTIQDSQIASQILLALKVPTPRVTVAGITAPFTANATGIEVVAGTFFKDASDGSVEGHYGTWTIDGVPQKYKPNANDIAVGAVGPHTLTFQGSYGKYDQTNLTGTGLYNTPVLTLGYVVKPFRAVINAPTTVGSDVRFTATEQHTTDTSILSAATWTVTWTFTSASAGGVSTSAAVSGVPQVVPVGQIPSFDVPKANVTSGSTVALKIEVDPTGLSTGAAPYAQAIASSILTTPDPLIEVTGCGNAGSPCKFVAKSVANASMSDWAYSWTLKRGTSVVGTSSSAIYEPNVTVAGDYSITLKTTKTVFEKEVTKNFTVAQSLCGPLPTALNVAINKIGCSASCAVGTLITFSPSFNGYTKQACDTISWDFGDGTTGTGTPATHSYSVAKTYTVKMTVSNSNGSMNDTTTVTVTGGGTENPDQCTAPTTATFTYAGSVGCAPGTNCRTTETISFTPKRGVGSLQTCDQVSWNFGDNTTSTSRTPAKNYTTPGTYTVTLNVTNTAGSSGPITRDIVVVVPPTSSCNQAPALGNFAISYSGATSKCSNVNPSCSHGETVTLNAQAFQYAVGSCDSFEWDFGDGSAKGSGQQTTHTFTGGLASYDVKVKVKNVSGEYTYSKAIKFAGTAPTKEVPTISPTTFPATGRKGTAVTFTASSNLPNTTGWTWNFGDNSAVDTSQAGLVSQTSTITHTFTKSGPFTVKATARNSEDAATAPVGVAQANIVITDPPAIPEYRFLLPATANLTVPGGAWRTDVQIYNPDPQVSETKPLLMEATFKGKTYQLEMIKSAHSYVNFLSALLDGQREDQGPVIITTKNAMTPPQIWTRTYFESAAGTYGQFIPAIRIDNIGGSGATTADGAYFLSGLRHDNIYRTNVGFLNPNAVTMNLTVKVYDEEGFSIGEFPLTLQPFQLDQFLLKSRIASLPTDAPFSIKIDVPAAQWLVAYASHIDGRTGDPVYLQAVRDTDVTSADFKTSVVPGVGHTGNWRSDVTIFNPDRTGMQFDIRYYNSAGVKKGEALNVKLGAGEFLQYGDILKQGILGSVEDGLGTLKISVNTEHSVYPMTFARTYFDDVANGTYGQGIGGFSPARTNVKPNKPAFIAGVRNSDTYYTNIGLVNVTDAPVTATVTLLDPNTGAGVASIPYTLAPNQSLVGAFNGFGALTSGTLKIEANGNVWAFCSVIDRRTKDPEYVPAIPAQ